MVQSRGSELGPLTNTLTRTLPHDARNKTELIFSIIVTGEIKAEEPQALLCHLPLQAARSLPSLQPSTLLPQPFGHLEISLQETQTLNCGSGDCQSRTRAPAPAGRAPRPGPAEPRAAPRGQPEELPRRPRGRASGPRRPPPAASPLLTPAAGAPAPGKRCPGGASAAPAPWRPRSPGPLTVPSWPRRGGRCRHMAAPQRHGRAGGSPAGPSQDGTGLFFPRFAPFCIYFRPAQPLIGLDGGPQHCPVGVGLL